MSRRGKRKSIREIAHADLELMPMLNVFIAIIPLLLLSAAFVPVAIINTAGPVGAAAGGAPTDDGPLELTLFIRKAAYVIEVNGTIVGNIVRSAQATTELAETLKQIAASHPGNREVRIVSEPKTRYEELIEVMDASRAAGLPEAALAQSAEVSS